MALSYDDFSRPVFGVEYNGKDLMYYVYIAPRTNCGIKDSIFDSSYSEYEQPKARKQTRIQGLL